MSFITSVHEKNHSPQDINFVHSCNFTFNLNNMRIEPELKVNSDYCKWKCCGQVNIM